MEELSQKGMVKGITKVFSKITDPRKGKNIQFSFVDIPLAAFSVFFTQCPSFLYYQIALQERTGRNNAASLFGIDNIPTDDQIRSVLDRVSTIDLKKVHQYFFRLLNVFESQGCLKQFRIKEMGNTLLVAFDATDHFASGSIHCDFCKTHTHADGEKTYSHAMVNPAIVAPQMKGRVISLAPEFIVNSDGEKKQDCEINASKRWISEYGVILATKNATIIADDLYAHEPFLKLLLSKKLQFIITCKRESHKYLYEWLDGLTEAANGYDIHVVQERVFTGRTHELHFFRYANQIPIKDGKDVLLVNWCELTIINEKTKEQTYMNSWITDCHITEKNISVICLSGRTRWKTENENNNILKNHGYYLEHNYGHGKNNLASILTTLILLSFLMHTILSFTDHTYQTVRLKLKSNQVFFRDVTALTKYFPFVDFEQLMFIMLKGLNNQMSQEDMAKLFINGKQPQETSPPKAVTKQERSSTPLSVKKQRMVL